MTYTLHSIFDSFFVYNLACAKCNVYVKSFLNDMGKYLNLDHAHYLNVYLFSKLVPQNV